MRPGGGVIEASVPVRICDNGGWTDTWFGGPGRVVNIAVNPGVEVSIRATAGPGPGGARRRGASATGTRSSRAASAYRATRCWRPRSTRFRLRRTSPWRSACVPRFRRAAAPARPRRSRSRCWARWRRCAPSNARHATSRTPRIASRSSVLGAESGIQDQLSAAFGGINYLEIEPYPEATVQTLPAWEELGVAAHAGLPGPRPRLLERAPPGHRRCSRVAVFYAAARRGSRGRDAVLAQDLDAFGQAMIANTDAQRSLHPELVGVDARQRRSRSRRRMARSVGRSTAPAEMAARSRS